MIEFFLFHILGFMLIGGLFSLGLKYTTRKLTDEERAGVVVVAFIVSLFWEIGIPMCIVAALLTATIKRG